MNKKNEFSDVVKNVERKFQEIEQQKKRRDERIKKIKPQEKTPHKKSRLEESQELQKFRIKEKLTYGLVIFAIGQIMILTVCFKNPQHFLGLWLIGTFSLSIICIAVVDYS